MAGTFSPFPWTRTQSRALHCRKPNPVVFQSAISRSVSVSRASASTASLLVSVAIKALHQPLRNNSGAILRASSY
jgi:hypothetical protein